MLKPDQIPKEAIDAATRRCGCGTCRKAAREEIASALNAWPGVGVRPHTVTTFASCIILPLPQDASDE